VKQKCDHFLARVHTQCRNVKALAPWGGGSEMSGGKRVASNGGYKGQKENWKDCAMTSLIGARVERCHRWPMTRRIDAF